MSKCVREHDSGSSLIAIIQGGIVDAIWKVKDYLYEL